MANAKPMLDTYPRDFNVDADILSRCVDECYACAETCTMCADSCLGEEDVQMLAKCIRLNLDCADICTAAGRVTARQTEYDAKVTRAIVEACARKHVRAAATSVRATHTITSTAGSARSRVGAASRRAVSCSGQCSSAAVASS